MPTLGTWGRALALRLPSHIVQTAQLKAGMTCDCRLLDDGSIRVKLRGTQATASAAAASELPGNAPRQEPTKW